MDTSAHIRPMSVAFDLQSHSRRRVERTIRECDSGGLGLLCPARRRGQVLPRIGLARRRGTEVRVAGPGFALQARPGLASESRSQLRPSQAAAAAGHCRARALLDALAQARLDWLDRRCRARSGSGRRADGRRDGSVTAPPRLGPGHCSNTDACRVTGRYRVHIMMAMRHGL